MVDKVTHVVDTSGSMMLKCVAAVVDGSSTRDVDVVGAVVCAWWRWTWSCRVDDLGRC